MEKEFFKCMLEKGQVQGQLILDQKKHFRRGYGMGSEWSDYEENSLGSQISKVQKQKDGAGRWQGVQ